MGFYYFGMLFIDHVNDRKSKICNKLNSAEKCDIRDNLSHMLGYFFTFKGVPGEINRAKRCKWSRRNATQPSVG